jgi:peroxiredoxin
MALLYSPTGEPGMKLPAFNLPKVDGGHFDSKTLASHKAKLVAFICAHCPYVQAIEGRLIALGGDLAKLNVPMLAVCSNDPEEYPEDAPAALKKRALEKGYTFPYLIDADQSVAQSFGAVCTPDFFVFDIDDRLVYRGRLDDSWKDATKVTNRELYEAIVKILGGTKKIAEQKPSMGCSINGSKGISMLRDKLLNTLTAALFVIGAACIVWVVTKNWSVNKSNREVGNLDCVKEQFIETIKDPHMEAVYPEGAQVKVLSNYYQCNPIQKSQHVWFKFSESIRPVVRIVAGIPGDRYELSQESSNERWVLKINGEPLKAENGEAYFIESKNVPPLKTYEISRKGILRDEEYILVSANPPGLTDSGNLGLIAPEKFAGRVLPKD